MERVIGCHLFIIGIKRDVYEVAEGRQYVYDDDVKMKRMRLPPTDGRLWSRTSDLILKRSYISASQVFPNPSQLVCKTMQFSE
jgi:hypothetical protein